MLPQPCKIPTLETDALPVNALVRGPVVVAGGKNVNPVVGIDPRPLGLGINQATNAPPSDGFYSPVNYRGGFSQTENWCLGWTASDEFGFFLGGGIPAMSTVTVRLASPTSPPSSLTGLHRQLIWLLSERTARLKSRSIWIQ